MLLLLMHFVNQKTGIFSSIKLELIFCHPMIELNEVYIVSKLWFVYDSYESLFQCIQVWNNSHNNREKNNIYGS